MALKVLMLRKRLNEARKELDEARAAMDALETRENELMEDIKAASTDEELDVVDDAIKEHDAEKAEHADKVSELERKVAELEGQIAETETEQEPAPAPEERKDESKMEIRDMNTLIARDDVKAYLGEVRSAIREKRALTNVGLTIPEVMLGMIRENIEGYSKLYKHVAVRRVGGQARQIIMGTVPEAIWTDCCANLNELTLGFNDLEMDCYKVGGYFAVCNANLEDSDVALATELVSALGQAIGLALDKAILYGRNAAGAMKMPQGIVSRLAQTSQPSGYPATARAWADLHTSNMITVSADNSTGVKLIQALVGAAGKCRNNYSRGGLTWCMNEATYTKLITEMVVINASGAIVSGIGATMPVVGGDIVILPFMGNDQIVVGYFGLYLLAERAGNQFASSEHVRFLSDETVFKGTARYDGAPEIAESFVAIGIGGTSPSANMTFTGDTANDVETVWLPATATVAANATITLTPVVAPNNAKTTFTWASATTAKATVSDAGVVTGVAAGTSVITVTTANGKSAQCTVTVTSA